MKINLESFLPCAALLLLFAAPVQADTAEVHSQLAFTISLSSGDLNVTPIGGLTTAEAFSSVPTSVYNESTTTDEYAMATAEASNGIGLTLNSGDYFLADAFASTEVMPGVTRSASATAVSLYDLSFSNVRTSTVTITLTPVFFVSMVPTVAATPGLAFGYVSAFLSLGDAFFTSYESYGDASGYVDFMLTPMSIEVASDAIVQLNTAVTAGLSVPDTSSSLGLLALGMVSIVAFRRKFVPAHA